MKSAYTILFIVFCTRLYFYFITPKPFSDGDKIKVTSIVKTEPIIYDNSQYFKIEGLKIYLPNYPKVSYGDRVVIEGVVESDKLKSPKLIDLTPAGNNVFGLRNNILDIYDKVLPKPHSSLIAGMVLGSKSGIGEDFWEVLKNSGTAHVVVASGMNVTLISVFLVSLFTYFFRRKTALLFAMAGIWLYALLSGFDTPIIRASIMGSTVFLAQETGRLSSAIRALIITGIIMLFINPGWVSDTGFLLSFFATLSLIIFGGGIKNIINKYAWSDKGRTLALINKIKDIVITDFSTSLAAQIGVTPILYYFFGQLNVFSPFINAVVLWTVAPITILGMIGGMLGLIWQPLSVPFLYLAYPMTTWFAWVVNLAGK